MEKPLCGALVTCGKTLTTATWSEHLKVIAVLLLRNNDQQYNNLRASFATCLCRQRERTWANCAKRVGGLAVTTLPQDRNQSGRSPLKHFSLTLEKSVGQSLTNLGPSQRTLRHTWCPKLVTALLCPVGPRVHLSGPAYKPSCERPEVRLPLD